MRHGTTNDDIIYDQNVQNAYICYYIYKYGALATRSNPKRINTSMSRSAEKMEANKIVLQQ